MDRRSTTLRRPLVPDSSSFSDSSDSVEEVDITEEEVGEINITKNIPNAGTLPSSETGLSTSTLKTSLTESESIQLFELQFGPGSLETLPAGANIGSTIGTASNSDTPMLSSLESLSVGTNSESTTKSSSNLDKPGPSSLKASSAGANSRPATPSASNLNQPGPSSLENLSAGTNSGSTTRSTSNLDNPGPSSPETLSAGANSRQTKRSGMPRVSAARQRRPKFQTGCNRRSGVRKAYGDLIETCQNFAEKEGVEKNLQTIMANNISEGNRLFQGLKQSGGGPGDMLMAIRHTKTCSEVIRNKSSGIGSSASPFNLDTFLKGLTAKAKNSLNEYDPRKLIENVSKQAALACTTAPSLRTPMGVLHVDEKSTQKEKKQRATRKQFDNQGLTTPSQHEEINISENSEAKRSSGILAQGMLEVVKKGHQVDSRATNLFELALDKTSFSGTLERLYNIGSMARDGDIGVSREKPKEGEKEKPGDSCLAITPAKPIRKSMLGPDDTINNEGGFNQHILSFSAARYRQLCAAAKGEDLIEAHKSPNPP